MEELKKYKWIILVVLLLVLVSFLSYLFYLNHLFSDKEPSDDAYIKLFNTYTQAEFPKSGILIKKDYVSGLNDGWHAAVIEVKDSTEYFTLKKEILQKDFIYSGKKKPKSGYFGSGIQKGFRLSDSIASNPRNLFVLEFLNNEKIIIFEKNW